MDSHRLARFLPAARTGAIASSLATVAILLLPHVAFAATPIGSAAGTVPCNPGFDIVQSSSSGPSYTVPVGGGSITSWSTLAGPGDVGPAQLEVWRLKSPGLYTLVGISPSEALTPSTTPNTFQVNIAVKAGDLLGLHVDGPLRCLLKTTSTSDTIAQTDVATPAVGLDQALTPDFFPYHLNVAATLGATAPGTEGCDQSGESSGNAQCSEKDKAKDKSKG
jgi:hypothetical protein